MGGAPWLDVSFAVAGELVAQEEGFGRARSGRTQTETEKTQGLDQ
jgi:hypothetical protein